MCPCFTYRYEPLKYKECPNDWRAFLCSLSFKHQYSRTESCLYKVHIGYNMIRSLTSKPIYILEPLLIVSRHRMFESTTPAIIPSVKVIYSLLHVNISLMHYFRVLHQPGLLTDIEHWSHIKTNISPKNSNEQRDQITHGKYF